MKQTTKCTINLSNSIIGVSLLAMPLCFKQCGIILSLILVALSFTVNRFSCYLLLKSAMLNRRRNYEVLAFDVFGVPGKRLVEICVLLFLLGTCIAFFVVLGDISSSLVAQFFNVPNSPNVRTLIVTFLAMFAILPLGLLPNVDALTSFSMVSLFVYIFLGLTMAIIFFFKHSESSLVPSVASLDTKKHSITSYSFWNSENAVSYLPIFSMALSCQSQLFEIFQMELYQADRGSLKLMMFATNRALKICSGVYTFMGIFGYLAFYDHDISGNILQMLPAGFITKFTLFLFMITILTSFPLCLFPSRTSFHSLIFRKAGYHDLKNLPHTLRMTDMEFKCITIGLIVLTLGISILFPHVELILALVGSTIGTLICFILPGFIFVKLSDKNTVEYLMSFLLIFFGIIILIFCTFSAVQKISVAREMEIETKIKELKKETPPPPTNETHLETATEPFLKTEYKAKIHNITKLKESIQKDINTFQKKEDEVLLHKLEKQQKEQSKIIEEQAKVIKELKTNVKQLEETKVQLPAKPAVESPPANASISVKIVLPKSEDSGKKKLLPSDAVSGREQVEKIEKVPQAVPDKVPVAEAGNASPASAAVPAVPVVENNPSSNANNLSKQHRQLPISRQQQQQQQHHPNSIENDSKSAIKEEKLLKLKAGQRSERNIIQQQSIAQASNLLRPDIPSSSTSSVAPPPLHRDSALGSAAVSSLKSNEIKHEQTNNSINLKQTQLSEHDSSL